MSGAVATIAVGAVAGAAISSMMQSPKAPQVQAPAAPPQAAQGAKAPDYSAFRRRNAGGGGGGTPGSTFLTGSSGVDPSGVQIGKNDLLGS